MVILTSQQLVRPMRRMIFVLLAVLTLAASGLAEPPVPADGTKWWGSAVDTALEKSGANRSGWEAVLAGVEAQQRVALEFLLSHMPVHDLETLSPARILHEIALVYRARAAVPWGKQIPTSLFLNDVLPYANIDEPRDPWRGDFFDRFLPLVRSCDSPGEAALRLNAAIFETLQVKYSTERKRANQSPHESIEQGLASCTGLSILLVDACRAVCIPARLVGIADWPNKEGNHTWVEIWDGDWHFLGAAEPSSAGLDHAWFTADAAQAQKDSPRHSILAASYQPGDARWPLVWQTEASTVPAVNVTDRYVGSRDESAQPTQCRLLVDVFDHARHRVTTLVSLVDAADPANTWFGHSHDDTHDTNDLLVFRVPKERLYRITTSAGVGRGVTSHITCDADEQTLTLTLPSYDEDQATRDVAATAKAWFDAAADERHDVTFLPPDDRAFAKNAPAVRLAVWKAFCQSDAHEGLRKDFAEKLVRFGKHVSPYTIRRVGKRPPAGWPLVIAMHGGGGAPAEVNDSQWRHMQIYYRDQQQLPGYKYLALRAPNDTWNGFYDDYVYPLVHRLILQQVLCADVDPDRVFLIGYSHGGYGAFAIGPKMPDHFAAIHSSAAAPTDGQSLAETLRNTRFTFMIGAQDEAHGRAERCQTFAARITQLRGERTDIYPVAMEWMPDFGHGGLPDRDKIAEMYPFIRNVTPRSLDWHMSDDVIQDFFWLSCDSPHAGGSVAADCRDQRLEISTSGCEQLTVWLDERLIEFDQPLTIHIDGQTLPTTMSVAVEQLCQSLWRRGDLGRSFGAAVAWKKVEGQWQREADR